MWNALTRQAERAVAGAGSPTRVAVGREGTVVALTPERVLLWTKAGEPAWRDESRWETLATSPDGALLASQPPMERSRSENCP